MIISRWIQSGCSTLPKNTMSTHLGLRARNYFKYLVHVFFPLWLYAADSSCVLHLCGYLTSQLMLKVCPELPHARQELSPNTSSNRLFTKLNWRDGFLQTGPKLSQVWTIHAVWLQSSLPGCGVLEGKQEVHWLASGTRRAAIQGPLHCWAWAAVWNPEQSVLTFFPISVSLPISSFNLTSL